MSREDVFRENRYDPVPAIYYRQKSRKCAEVLVPNRVPPNLIFGAYAKNDEQADRTREIARKVGRADFRVDVNGYMFFQGGRGDG